tara:strand:- start:212 stop:382 length:171 start_codon:yes stop_codon:yes gene_type:complete
MIERLFGVLLRFKIDILIKIYNKLFRKNHKTVLVWSADTNKIDEDGGPYEVKITKD